MAKRQTTAVVPTGREVTSVDLIIAERLVQLRKKSGLSQIGLANLVGVTFQQIQKYEKGANRVSASRLFEIAKVLNIPLSYFFEPTKGDVRPLKKSGGSSAGTGAKVRPDKARPLKAGRARKTPPRPG